jgi:hypothetical protein
VEIVYHKPLPVELQRTKELRGIALHHPVIVKAAWTGSDQVRHEDSPRRGRLGRADVLAVLPRHLDILDPQAAQDVPVPALLQQDRARAPPWTFTAAQTEQVAKLANIAAALDGAAIFDLAVLLGLVFSLVFSGFENLPWLSLATFEIVAVWIKTALFAGREFRMRAAAVEAERTRQGK